MTWVVGMWWRVPAVTAACLTLSPVFASDFVGLFPGGKEAKDVALAMCYASRQKERELSELSSKLVMHVQIFGAQGEKEVVDSVFTRALRQSGDEAWGRYRELGGPAATLAEVKPLPDPCLGVRRAF